MEALPVLRREDVLIENSFHKGYLAQAAAAGKSNDLSASEGAQIDFCHSCMVSQVEGTLDKCSTFPSEVMVGKGPSGWWTATA